MHPHGIYFGFLSGNHNLVMVFNRPLPRDLGDSFRLKANPNSLVLLAGERVIAKQPMPSQRLYEDLMRISALGGVETDEDGTFPDCITTTIYVSTFARERAA